MKTILSLFLLISLPLFASDAKTAWLGVAAHENIDGDRYLPGVVVAFVWVDSPASQAGLLEDDVIVAIGKNKPRSPEHLGRLVRLQKPGSTITLDFHRDGQPKSIQVTLGTLSEAREKGAMLTEDFRDKSPIQKSSDITTENAKRVWNLIENDTKKSLLGMGFSPEHVARVIAQMKPAGAELVKVPDLRVKEEKK